MKKTVQLGDLFYNVTQECSKKDKELNLFQHKSIVLYLFSYPKAWYDIETLLKLFCTLT